MESFSCKGASNMTWICSWLRKIDQCWLTTQVLTLFVFHFSGTSIDAVHEVRQRLVTNANCTNLLFRDICGIEPLMLVSLRAYLYLGYSISAVSIFRMVISGKVCKFKACLIVCLDVWDVGRRGLKKSTNGCNLSEYCCLIYIQSQFSINNNYNYGWQQTISPDWHWQWNHFVDMNKCTQQKSFMAMTQELGILVCTKDRQLYMLWDELHSAKKLLPYFHEIRIWKQNQMKKSPFSN